MVTMILFCAFIFWLLVLIHGWLKSRSSADGAHLTHVSISGDVYTGPRAGVKSIQGLRPYMEDAYQVKLNLPSSVKPAYFAIFDGHGGHRCAEYAAQNVHDFLVQSLEHDSNPRSALVTALKRTDDEWLAFATPHAHDRSFDAGSTCVVALVVDGTLYVANIGDSRAVLSRKTDAVCLSDDHKPDPRANEHDMGYKETKRIERLGGSVSLNGTWRVQGVLAVSRALGDRRLKRFVTADADVRVHQLRHGDDFLILATDGVWDVISPQAAVDLVGKSCPLDVNEAASCLVDTAFQLRSTDNITALVVDLRQYSR